MSVELDPVVLGEDRAIMDHIEARLNRFENKNTWWRHDQNGTMDQFDAAFDAAVEGFKAKLGQKHPLYIGGQAVERDTFETTSPADTSVVVGHWAKGTKEDVREAVRISKEAQPAWAARSWQERAEIIEKASAFITEHFYDFCAVMTWETGKTRFEASIDVDEGVDFGYFYAMNYREHGGYDMLMGKPFPNETCRSIRKPVGVFGVVCPFNFPVAITFGMAAAALLTGNAAIIKPSMKGCFSGKMVHWALISAGVPGEVCHFITGEDAEVGAELLENPDIDGLVFTGSKHIGMMALAKQVEQGRPKPFIAEMGGKNAVLITKNADLDKAVQGVYKSAFGFSGQKCSACSRVYVHRDVADEFLDRLGKLTAATTIGHPAEKTNFMGPVIEARKLDLYRDVIENVKRDGGTIVTGGNVLADELGGHYVEPTVVTGLPLDHRVFREEFFMPFAAVAVVDSLEEAVAEYNKVEYGLTAGVMTEDEDEQQYFFDHVESGVTYANRAIGGSTGAVVNGQSFVGWKLSGSTGTGAGGRYYLLQFTRERSQTIA
ncbi:MAG: aldehyde dehydrogenase family protein [Thermoplasmatota archaeon]